MRQGDQVELNQSPRVESDAHRLIVELAKGRRVLNVGAAGNAEDYLDGGEADWLHAQIAAVAVETVGLDIDEQSVRQLSERGYDTVCGNAEDAALKRKFDLVVMSDVIEHFDNPGIAIANMMAHLDDDGDLVMTTPNATAWSLVARAALRKSMGIYWDHVAVYAPEHIQAMCDRHGYTVADLALFTDVEGRRRNRGLKHIVSRLATRMVPRFHGWIYCRITR